MFEGARLAATTPDPVDLEYLYDFDSIFANPDQETLFSNPYGPRNKDKKQGFVQGGQVEDENDRLLRLIGGM